MTSKCDWKTFQSCYDVDISNYDQKNPLIVLQMLVYIFFYILRFYEMVERRSVHFMRVIFTHFMTVLTDYGRSMKPFFSLKLRTFGLGQTIWADQFWVIRGIFGRFSSTHFGTVSPLSLFYIIQPLFLKKTKTLYPHPKYLFGIGIWILGTKN